ncbi:MAG: lytic transglycosylase, partial [Cyanobium sp. RS427]|nr:lytic transglycosylase [Cyanobium sp. RS427]
MAPAPRFAAVLLLATAGISLTAALAGQHLLRSQRRPLTPAVQATDLWRIYRWSPDPDQRRRAALLMSSSGHGLQGQG